MKKNKLKILFFLPLLFAILSCNNEADNTPTQGNFNKASREVVFGEIKAFEADVKASALGAEMKSWKEALDKQDFVSADKHQVTIDKTLTIFYEKYKKENVDEYVQLLHEMEVEELGEHDGDPCTKNRDGSIYLGACSFWQKVSFFMNFSCSGLPKDTPPQREHYMDCLQSISCRTCK